MIKVICVALFLLLLVLGLTSNTSAPARLLFHGGTNTGYAGPLDIVPGAIAGYGWRAGSQALAKAQTHLMTMKYWADTARAFCGLYADPVTGHDGLLQQDPTDPVHPSNCDPIYAGQPVSVMCPDNGSIPNVCSPGYLPDQTGQAHGLGVSAENVYVQFSGCAGPHPCFRWDNSTAAFYSIYTGSLYSQKVFPDYAQPYTFNIVYKCPQLGSPGGITYANLTGFPSIECNSSGFGTYSYGSLAFEAGTGFGPIGLATAAGGAWHALTVVFNGASSFAVVDSGASQPFIVGMDSLTNGGGITGFGTTVTAVFGGGLMEEWWVWPGALTMTQITALHANQHGPNGWNF